MTGKGRSPEIETPVITAETLAAAIKQPTADAANTPNVDLLQLLAHSSPSEDADTPSTDVTSSAPRDETQSSGKTANADPDALILAMLSQAFGGAPGAAPVAPGNPAPTAAAGGSTAGIPDLTRSSPDTAAHALVSLLAQKLSADDPGKTDTQPSDKAAATAPADNKGATDNTSAVAQSLAQLGLASHFSRNTNTIALQSPVGSPAWKDELGGQLTWMTHRGLESGSLRVSPEHLGPVEVKITVQNGDASVWFGANHPDTRAALEQALPRLREMFASQGLTLTDSGVSRESPRNQSRSPVRQSVAGVSAVGGAESESAIAARISLGLVDTYA